MMVYQSPAQAYFYQKDMIEHQIRTTGWHSDPHFFGLEVVVDLFSEQTTFLAKTHPVLEAEDFQGGLGTIGTTPSFPLDVFLMALDESCINQFTQFTIPALTLKWFPGFGELNSCTRHRVDHCFQSTCIHVNTHTIRSTLYRHLWMSVFGWIF